MWKVVQPGALAMAEAAGIRITMSFILWGTVEVSVGSCIIHCSITGIGSQPDNHTTIKCTVKQKYKTIHSKSGKKNVNENGKRFTCEQSEKRQNTEYETTHQAWEKKGSVKWIKLFSPRIKLIFVGLKNGGKQYMNTLLKSCFYKSK